MGIAPAWAIAAKKLSIFASESSKVDRIDRRIAKIRDAQRVIWRHAVGVDPAHQAGLVADFPRAMARPRAVGGAAIERHADQGDIHQRRVGDHRQTHEARHAGKARNQRGINGFEQRAHENRAI